MPYTVVFCPHVCILYSLNILFFCSVTKINCYNVTKSYCYDVTKIFNTFMIKTYLVCGMVPYAGFSFYCFEMLKFFSMKYAPNMTCNRLERNTGKYF